MHPLLVRRRTHAGASEANAIIAVRTRGHGADRRRGQVIGVRYGQIAYDVIVRDLVFRNVAPERVRLAPSRRERVAFQTKPEPIPNFLDRLKIARARKVTH